jgi:hypothetical protein
MSNRIRNAIVQVRRLSAAEAELWVTVTVDSVTPTMELRGRFTGPRCPGVTTVEVAYPLRPVSRPGAPANTLTARVLIPEPNFWTETTPYVYERRLELWENGVMVCTETGATGLKQPQ